MFFCFSDHIWPTTFGPHHFWPTPLLAQTASWPLSDQTVLCKTLNGAALRDNLLLMSFWVMDHLGTSLAQDLCGIPRCGCVVVLSCCVVLCCGVSVRCVFNFLCPSKIWALPRLPAPSIHFLRRTASAGPPDISRFFLPHSHFLFLFLSLGIFSCLFFSLRGSSRGILVVFWSVGTSYVLVFALRLYCEAPGGLCIQKITLVFCIPKKSFCTPKKSHPGSGASMLPVNRGSHGAMIIFLGEQPESPRNLGCEGNELVRRLVQTRSARLRSAQDQPTRASASARQWTKEIASVPCDHRLCVTNKCVGCFGEGSHGLRQ